jgi:hypothetical protein
LQPPPLKRLLMDRAPWLVHFKRRCEGFYRKRQSALHLRTAMAAVAAFPKISRRRRSGLPGELIISLTSYPPRFPTLAATLKSLLDQRLQADRVILWVSDDDMSSLPAEVLELRHYGLTISPCADTKSYKKLIPALRDFPDAFLVTADDDIYYPPNWLEVLVGCVDADRPEIIGTRGHIAIMDRDGSPLPYTRWIMETKATVISQPGQALFLTGIGGVLYPPHSLHDDATRQDLFMRLCPRGDDIWFFAMSELAGTPRRRAARFVPLTPWPPSQDVGLFHENVAGSGNDRQLQSVIDVYGALRSRFATGAETRTDL